MKHKVVWAYCISLDLKEFEKPLFIPGVNATTDSVNLVALIFSSKATTIENIFLANY